MAELIGTERTLELLAKVVEAKGADYVYPGTAGDTCYNFEVQGAPSCIVGHVLAELGVTKDQAAEVRVDGSAGVNDTVEALVRNGWKYTFSIGAVAVLYRAQNVQDQRRSWGDALRMAAVAAEDYVHNERHYGQPYIRLTD